jgi:hypothetical protein
VDDRDCLRAASRTGRIEPGNQDEPAGNVLTPKSGRPGRGIRQAENRDGNLSNDYAGGAVSNISSPSANATHGCLLRVQMCRVGRSHDVSSSVPALTRMTPSRAGPAIHDPQSGQTHRMLVLPLSARRWRARGSTPLRLNAASDTTTPKLKALLVSRWQSRQ